MSTDLNPELIHELADRLLLEGKAPTPATLRQRFSLSAPDRVLEEALESWWSRLEGRVSLAPAAGRVPDALTRAVRLLWEDAVREAANQLNLERGELDSTLATLQHASTSAAHSVQADYEELEDRLKRQQMINGESLDQVKALEAEVSTLKSSLAGEISLRKQAEEKLRDVRNDLKRELRSLEDAKRTFDQRLRDAQTHGQDQVAKAEAETRHYRTSLEKLRDEAGKKEAALTKNLHDLRGDLAKKEVKIESLKGQVKGLEGELKTMRAETGTQSRELSKANAKVLALTNQSKRQETQIKELESEIRQERQRLSQASAEALRKEAELRALVKAREDEVVRAKAGLSGLKQRIAGQEEQIRRLSAQLRE